MNLNNLIRIMEKLFVTFIHVVNKKECKLDYSIQQSELGF